MKVYFAGWLSRFFWFRHRLVHRPENSVDKQPTELRISKVVRMTQRCVENAGLFVAISPGHRLRLLVGNRANQQPLR